MLRTIALGPALLAVVLAVVAAGCDHGTGRSTTSSTTRACGIGHPTGVRDLVVRVASGGGLVRPETGLGEVPELSVYGDGRAIVTGPVIEIYPPPALPNLLESSLTEAELQALLHPADAGLLDREVDTGRPGVTDQPVTTITVDADGEEHVTEVYALGFDGPGFTEQQQEARERINAFVAKAHEKTNGLGVADPDTGSTSRPYALETLAVFTAGFERAAPNGACPPETLCATQPVFFEWPLEDLATAGVAIDVPGYRCVVVAGGDAPTVLGAARSANALTPWTSGGVSYALVFRPLLPDESSCAEVA